MKFAAVSLVAVSLTWFWAQVNAAGIELLSVANPSLPSASAIGDSGQAVFSGDGRFLLFTSAADDLVTNCHNGLLTDVFVRELATGRITLVSVTPDGGDGGNGNSSYASIADDGRYVAFVSTASNLVSSDTNGVDDVFVRDLVMGTTTLVSANFSGIGSGNGASINPVITADGQRIFFQSRATDLVSGDDNLIPDVFVYDVQAGKTSLVSVDLAGRAGKGSPNAASRLPTTSDDGRVVAFTSTATNLAITVSTGRATDIYVRNLNTNGTFRLYLSNVTNFVTINNFALSGNGSYLAVGVTERSSFASFSSFYWFDLRSGTAQLACAGLEIRAIASSAPAISRDGRTIAFEAGTTSYNLGGSNFVYTWNPDTGLRPLRSGTAADSPFIEAYGAVLSSDGTRIAYLSEATNLAAGATTPEVRLYVRNLATGLDEVVAVDATGIPVPGAKPFAPAFSPDGRYLAFESTSPDLAPNDRNHAADIFLRDLTSKTVQLISTRDPAAATSNTGGGPSRLGQEGISADGRFVVFSSGADNLVPNDQNGRADAFVRDLATGQITLVSATPDGLASGNGESVNPVISGDGRFVAFVSTASNLAGNDTNGVEDVFLRDLQTKTTTALSVRPDGSATGDHRSSHPSISADGQRIAFDSFASDLTGGPTNLLSVYVHDVTTHSNRLVIPTASPNSFSPVLSGDGQLVALFAGMPLFFDLQKDEFIRQNFGVVYGYWRHVSSAISLSQDGHQALVDDLPVKKPVQIYWQDETNTNRVVSVAPDGITLGSTNSSQPCISADGHWGVFTSRATNLVAGDLNGVADVFLRDLRAGKTALVSVNYSGTGPGNGASGDPSISADGRYVLFRSTASDLVPDDDNGVADIFVRDMRTGVTRLVSRRSDTAAPGNERTGIAAMSAGGEVVAFASFASDLATGDRNFAPDVFVVKLPADIDADGLSDEWELTSFGDLSFDGISDPDGDGASNLAEFFAGTLPKNADSVLRLSAATDGARLTLTWPSVLGRRYRLRVSDSLSPATWREVTEVLVGTGTAMSFADEAADGPSERFYQVVVAGP